MSKGDLIQKRADWETELQRCTETVDKFTTDMMKALERCKRDHSSFIVEGQETIARIQQRDKSLKAEAQIVQQRKYRFPNRSYRTTRFDSSIAFVP